MAPTTTHPDAARHRARAVAIAGLLGLLCALMVSPAAAQPAAPDQAEVPASGGSDDPARESDAGEPDTGELDGDELDSDAPDERAAGADGRSASTDQDVSADGQPAVRLRAIAVPSPAPDVRINGSGWGHGVGMSQYGAQAQALAGWGANRILRHWYRGVDVGLSMATASPIVVGLSTEATHPRVDVTEGVGRWQVCTQRCGPVRAADGRKVRQRPSDGPYRVRIVDGQLTLRDGDQLLWSGPPASRLRLRLSDTDARRTVAVVRSRSYRWGTLTFSRPPGAACRDQRMCVTLQVPSIEKYLRGLAEMPSSWAPAALRAQAITGRTYALRMQERGLRSTCRCHLVDTPADQAYAGLGKEEGAYGARWVAAVDASAGRVVRYDGTLAATFYSSSHAGRSENVSDSYAYSAPVSSYPYLRSVRDRWSSHPAAGNPYARWTQTVNNGKVASFLHERLRRVTGVEVITRTRGGTPRDLRITGAGDDGSQMTFVFSGRTGKPVGNGRAWIAGAEMKTVFGLRSQQISTIGLAPFVDDDGTTHEYALASLATAGVLDACAPGRSCPLRRLRRAEAAAMLARAFQLSTDGNANRFVDDDGSTYEREIDAAAAAGVVNGCRADTFCPDQVLSRAQMASLLSRALELPRASTDAFVDDGGSVHEEAINRLAAAGITAGTDSERFRPSGWVTRGQMASLVVRALGHAAR